ncbi:hypothetical protein [Bradyrhizobium sp. RD5-C2]|uniref:hypothetical protein n=1 Tax=Bradyrhizobium sp. RD5-C2 TaxID=244562 RepID=UPI001CC682FE|nr:hypothetical protein [Bradyrhizobium sp. RD5-C2]GIQ76210.1 hypothetical protein BraRD5C2_46540 [Bradyrhizobium sp. RD5-C2]
MKNLVLAIALVVPTIAFAEDDDEKVPPTITCDQFRERFTDALIGNGEGVSLASLFTGAKRQKFDVPGIQAAIGCTADGMFEGFGASLLEADDGSVKRYTRFSGAAVRAIEPRFDHAEAIQVVVDLTRQALEDARNTERKSGWLQGSAEKKFGSYVVDYRMNNSLVSTHIDLRYKNAE